MLQLLEQTLLGEESLGSRAGNTGSTAPSGGSRPPAAWANTLRTCHGQRARLQRRPVLGVKPHAPLGLAASPGAGCHSEGDRIQGPSRTHCSFPGSGVWRESSEEQSKLQAHGNAHAASPGRARVPTPTSPPESHFPFLFPSQC